MILRYITRAAEGSVQEYTEHMVTFAVISEGIYFLVYFHEILLGLKEPRQP